MLENGKRLLLIKTRYKLLFYNLGVFAASGGGILHTAYAKHDKRPDWIPVDIAINLMCVLAWRIGTQTIVPNTPRVIPIYNCTSGSTSSLLYWPELQSIGIKMLRKHPMEHKIWYPSTKINHYRIVDRLCRVFLHWIPAYCVDAFFYVLGKKHYSLVKITEKMTSAMDTVEYFVSREWSWNTQNVTNLHNMLSYEDHFRYNFSTKDFKDWDGYIEQYALGIRKFLMKSDPSTLESCRKNMWKFYAVHSTFKICALFMVYIFIYLIWIFIVH